MKMLTADMTKLLDKLYNLRGEDSVVLSKMEKERELAEETKERTTSEKATLQEKIENLTEEERILGEQGENLVTALSDIRTEDFKTVLDKLKIDFNPDKLSEQISKSLPETINRVQEETKSAEDELVKVESEMNTAIATIEELAIRKDEALENQTRLNEYFDLALNGNINITRDSITSLLEKFDFSEDECREAAKILMFPEDALYEYEDRLKNASQPGKSISEVFAEAKENVEDIVDNAETVNPVEEVEEEVTPLSPKDELISLLTELGFDYLDFTNNDLEKILANYNEIDLRHNVEFAKSHNLKLDLFIDSVELLYDKEFEQKINQLLEVGKEPFDIYLNPGVLVKYDNEKLESMINTLRDSGLDPRKVPLIAY